MNVYELVQIKFPDDDLMSCEETRTLFYKQEDTEKEIKRIVHLYKGDIQEFSKECNVTWIKLSKGAVRFYVHKRHVFGKNN